MKKEEGYRDALVACLLRIPSVTVEAIAAEEAEQGRYLRVQVGSPGRASRVLMCAFKDSGQPRWARQAINQLSEDRSDPNSYCVFIHDFCAVLGKGLSLLVILPSNHLENILQL